MNTKLLSALIRRDPTTGKRQLDSSLMGWLNMTYRQEVGGLIEETSPFWRTPSSESELRRQVLSWARMLKARPTLPEYAKATVPQDFSKTG